MNEFAQNKRSYFKYSISPIEKKELKGTIRVLASGGFLGFNEIFKNKTLGLFQCYIFNLNKPLIHIHKLDQTKGGIVVNM